MKLGQEHQFPILFGVIFLSMWSRSCLGQNYLPEGVLEERYVYVKSPSPSYNCSSYPDPLNGTPHTPHMTFHAGDRASGLVLQCTSEREDWVFWRKDSVTGQVMHEMEGRGIIVNANGKDDKTDERRTELQWHPVQVNGYVTCCNIKSPVYDCRCRLHVEYKTNGNGETKSMTAIITSTEYTPNLGQHPSKTMTVSTTDGKVTIHPHTGLTALLLLVFLVLGIVVVLCFACHYLKRNGENAPSAAYTPGHRVVQLSHH